MYGLVVIKLPNDPAAPMPLMGRLRRKVYVSAEGAYEAEAALDAARYSYQVVKLELASAVFEPPANQGD